MNLLCGPLPNHWKWSNLKSTIHWKAYVNLFILCNSYGSWQVWKKVHPIFIDLSSSPFIKEDWPFFWRKFACFEHAVSAFISPHNGGTWVTTRYNWTRPCFVEIRGHLNAFLNLNLSVSLSRGSNTQYTGIYKRSFGIVLRYESTPQRKLNSRALLISAVFCKRPLPDLCVVIIQVCLRSTHSIEPP